MDDLGACRASSELPSVLTQSSTLSDVRLLDNDFPWASPSVSKPGLQPWVRIVAYPPAECLSSAIDRGGGQV